MKTRSWVRNTPTQKGMTISLEQHNKILTVSWEIPPLRITVNFLFFSAHLGLRVGEAARSGQTQSCACNH